jgi:3-isopropylmalate dehydrogenase
MLRFGFGLDPAAKAIENAVDQVITEGYRTQDILRRSDAKIRPVGTSQMGDAIAAAI